MNQGIKFYKTYEVKKISDCHQSIGPKTLTPNSRFDRWSGVHNAISDWLLNEANDDVAVKVAEENFQFYDPLQRKIMSELFERFRSLVPKPLPQVNIDFYRQEIIREIDGEEKGMYTSFQYQLEDEENTEYIKLKAGVSDIEDIDRAKKIIKDNPILTTGIFGNLLKDVGAVEIFTKDNINPATDVAALLSTIQANIGFDRLDRMRQESPTGGALGQVAVKELDFLQATLGSLSQSQSSKQLIANLERLSDQYKSLIRNLANSKAVDEQGRSGVEFLKNYGFTDAQIASATEGGATGELGVDYIDGLSEEQLLRVDPLNDNLSEEAFDRYMERKYKR